MNVNIYVKNMKFTTLPKSKIWEVAYYTAGHE